MSQHDRHDDYGKKALQKSYSIPFNHTYTDTHGHKPHAHAQLTHRRKEINKKRATCQINPTIHSNRRK